MPHGALAHSNKTTGHRAKALSRSSLRSIVTPHHRNRPGRQLTCKTPTTNPSPLDRARRKAYWRLLPLLFLCYIIAYVDRTNVAIAKLTMSKDLPGFDNAVIGFGAGLFFWGYFLLEIPGALLVEKWSARKTMSRIMITWGFAAALTGFVQTPWQFYSVRFILGLAEAGFFPGVIIYLTHWFPARDRARALSLFLVATPVAQIISPKISNAVLKIGTDEVVNGATIHHPELLGLEGWQWVYILWGIPAVVLGVIVLFMLTDRPRDARWLTTDERQALEKQIELEKAQRARGRRMTLVEAFRNPKVLLLAAAYFCSTTANYGIEFFLPSILDQWYSLSLDKLTWLIILPPCLALAGQLFVGWNSDRIRERRCHAAVCLVDRSYRARVRAIDPRASAADDRLLHGRLRRDQVLPTGVLVAPELVPHRDGRGGERWPDQLGREPRWLSGPDGHRSSRPRHRVVRRGDLLSGRLPERLRVDHPAAGNREKGSRQ